jgi:tRNA threonylcarbamoyladenosine biosynthesis protein TsaE
MSEPARIALPDAAATRTVGIALGERLRALSGHGALIGLSGELGAGKTSFVGGVLSAFGEWGPIRSPTYTLIEPYELSGSMPARTIHHLDLYRLRGDHELEELGVRELLGGPDILLVEWIEKAPLLAAIVDVSLRLFYAPDGRLLELQSRSPLGAMLISQLWDAASPQ